MLATPEVSFPEHC